MTIQQINKKFIITKKESDMQKEQNYQTYILSQNIIHKYQGKRVQRAFNTHNRIVVVRQNQLIVLNANDTKLKSAININTDLILKFVANRQNYIAILFTTGVLEIRSLDNLNVVLHLFNNISFKTVRVFPILYWEDDDLYILNQNKIQIFNIYKKQRKVYSDLLSTEDSKKLLGIAESHLIDKQRIIIMHLADKLLLNIAPNPITQLPVANITKILTLSNRKYKSQTSSEIDRNPPRQYLVLVVDDRKLQVYNLMTMKQILQIEYERKEQEKMQLKTDRFKQYLLVTFISKKNKVKNNILYKVNTEQYYKGKQHLRNDSAFFQFSVQLHMKQDLMIFPSKEISHQHNRSITLDLGYHKYNLKKNNGQIVISTLVLNPQIVKAKGYKCQTNNSEWKQLRSWNEVISSYLQNKISIEKLNLILLETEQKEKQLQKLKKQKSSSTLKQKVKQKEVGQRVQKTKKKGRVMTQKECIDLENRYNQSEKYEKNILEEIKRQQEREEQRLRYEEQYEEYNEKFENIRNFNSLILNKSKGQEKWFFDLIKQFLNLQSLNIQNQDQLKIQYETTEEQNNSTPSIFIEAYPQKLLKQPFKSVSDLNQIRQQNKFKFRVTQNQLNQEKSIERQRQEVQQNSQKRKEKRQRSIKKVPDQKKQKDLEKDKDRKKLQKSITGSKSSEQISKNGMVSKSNERTWKNIPYQVQRVKSSTSQDQGVSFLQIESKNQVLTKSQQNQSKPEDGLDRELQSQEQDELMAEAQFLPQNQDILYIEKFTSKLAESLAKAFEPLQKKLDKLDQKLGRTESIHIAQLRRCQKIINRQQNELNNIDMNFKGYFYEMLNQFDKNLQNGLKCYWNKIEQIDKRNTKSRDKAINDFGVYIDHQIKSRQQIFDHNRICIQNNLTHLRKKMNAFMENQIYHNIYHEFEEEADQVGQVEDWEHKYRNQKNHRPYEEDQQEEDNEL